MLLHGGGAVGSVGAGLQQTGDVPAQVAALPNYGVAVPTKTGLKNIAPAGWKTYVHQSVTLPPTISWSRGQGWTAVLAELAKNHNLSVLVDWGSQTVLVRPPRVAAEDAATRKQIADTATTPLPKFVVEGPAPLVKFSTDGAAPSSAPGPGATTPGKYPQWMAVDAQTGAEVPRMPVVRANPTPAMVAAQAKAVQENPPTLKSSEDFSYHAANAWNKPSARKLAQGIAQKFEMRLVWSAPEEMLRGPVTLLAQSAEQDVGLLQKALGTQSAVELEVLTSERIIRAHPRGMRGQPWVDESSWESQAPATPVEYGATRTGALKLELGIGTSLESALVSFAREQGFTLEWVVDGGFESSKALTYTGNSIAEVLAQALPPLGISADVYTHDKHIIIRPGEIPSQ